VAPRFFLETTIRRTLFRFDRILATGTLLVLPSILAAPRTEPARATLPWRILCPARDAREPEVARFDDEMDARLVARLNETPELRGRVELSRGPIASILESGAAFASLHFDPTRPMALAPEEERQIEEYLVRGGFLLLIEDNYPYYEREYRARVDGTLFDFFARELPHRNPRFSAAKAEASHPIFTEHYPIVIPPFIRREMRENAHYRGETLFLYDGRLAGYTFSLYAFENEAGHVPLRPPYRAYDLAITGRELLVNIYLYSSQH
jgi:hypothetical protein